MSRTRPPLELDVEIETTDDVYTRRSDHRIASKRPRGISFSTQRGDGFGPASCSFSRPIFKDYPDIGPLDTWRFVGRNGDIAHESRLRSSPRTNDPQEQLEVQLLGWMTYLLSKQCGPLIIDGRQNLWTEPSLQRKADLAESATTLAAAVSPGWQQSSGKPGVAMDFTSVSTIAGRRMRGEAWFDAHGEVIEKLLYHLKIVAGGENNATWLDQAGFAGDDRAKSNQPGPDHNAITNSSEFEELVATSEDSVYALLVSDWGDGGGTAMTNIHSWEYPKVIGNHGLTLRGTWPEVGYYLSDILSYVIDRYFPKLTWAGDANTYIVTQAAYHDGALPGYQLIQQLNDLALWETNVWEERAFHFGAADLTKYDWIIRTTDPGVKVVFDGPSIEDFANGVEVKYTDFTGRSHILYPADHSELRDESDANPANRHGEDLWTYTEVPWPCYEAEALQFGRARLAEFNRPKRPGRYRIQGGYIRDAARHWQQGWKVRSSQTIGILDHPEDSPRLITATSWDAEAEILEVTVDAPPKTLDAIVARQMRARETANL